MFCGNCGNQVPEGNRFCPNCGAPAEMKNSTVVTEGYNAVRMREVMREEAERAARSSEVRRWADASFVFGILSICFIAIGAGILAIAFAFFFGIKSNRTADSIGIPREKKAKKGMMLACTPLAIGALAGIVVAILAICGVIG